MKFRALSEAFKNLSRNIWLSTTAISVLIVSMSLVAITGLIRSTANEAAKYYDKQATILVLLSNRVEGDEIKKVEEKIRQVANVKDVTFTSKDEEKERLIASDPSYKETIESLNTNPLRNSFRILPNSPENYVQLTNDLRTQFTGVFDRIQSNEDIASKLNNIAFWADRAGIAMIIIFSIVSVMIIINILRISIHNFKDEIEIMRLVGATNSYIQQPFIMQGVVYALIASVVVAGLFIPLMLIYGLPFIFKFLKIDEAVEQNTMQINMFLEFGIIFLAAILISALTSAFATKRYLKL